MMHALQRLNDACFERINTDMAADKIQSTGNDYFNAWCSVYQKKRPGSAVQNLL